MLCNKSTELIHGIVAGVYPLISTILLPQTLVMTTTTSEFNAVR